jgi:hypothetical protein
MMDSLPSEREGRSELIVAASLATGLVAALALSPAPFIPAKENILTGVVLLAFALGWALLAMLSTRFSNQPQRWAAAPAVFRAVAGLISLLPPGSVVQDVFGWVCGTSKSRNRLGVPQAGRDRRDDRSGPRQRLGLSSRFGGDATVGKSEPNGLIRIAFDARDVNLVMGAEG